MGLFDRFFKKETKKISDLIIIKQEVEKLGLYTHMDDKSRFEIYNEENQLLGWIYEKQVFFTEDDENERFTFNRLQGGSFNCKTKEEMIEALPNIAKTPCFTPKIITEYDNYDWKNGWEQNINEIERYIELRHTWCPFRTTHEMEYDFDYKQPGDLKNAIIKRCHLEGIIMNKCIELKMTKTNMNKVVRLVRPFVEIEEPMEAKIIKDNEFFVAMINREVIAKYKKENTAIKLLEQVNEVIKMF